MNNTAIKLQNVSKQYVLKQDKPTLVGNLNPRHKPPTVWALKDINLIINKGDRLGIIGPNGSGKTTLLEIMACITTPTSGQVTVKGKVTSLLGLTAGFHGELTGIENIRLQASLYGITKKQLKNIQEKIIKFADIGNYINQPLYTYSSGMVLRLGFAIIAHIEADIYLFDEFLVVGDPDFQLQCSQVLNKFHKQQKTLVIAAQQFTNLLPHCHQIITINHGVIDPTNIPDDNIIDFYKQALKHQFSESTITTNSMLPTLKIGDQVKYKNTSYNQLKVNDIVVFAFDNLAQLITHRIIGTTTTKKGRALTTQGDANQSIDPWLIYESNYIGKVTHINKKSLKPR